MNTAVSGFRVLGATEADGEVVVEVETTEPVLACPACGSLATTSKGRRRVKLRDAPSAGRTTRLVWAKRQRRCADEGCATNTFVEQRPEVGRRRRTTARCRAHVARHVGPECRPVVRVAAEVGLGWRAANAVVAEEVTRQALVDPDRSVRVLGVDETAVRRGRRFVTNLVDLERGAAHDVVPGRSHRVFADWLGERTPAWRSGVEVVALDPYAPCGAAVRELLLTATVVVDKFHGVRLFNRVLDSVRRRVTREAKGRRGRKVDPVWRARHRLLRANERLRDDQVGRLFAAFDDDPSGQVEYAYRVKEVARWFWLARSLEEARTRGWVLLGAMADSGVEELVSLGGVLDAWMPKVMACFATGVTNAATEGLDRKVRQVKRAGCGFRNVAGHRIRTMAHCGKPRLRCRARLEGRPPPQG